MGLLESDEEWGQCMEEAALSSMPSQICFLFVPILVFGEPTKPIELWLKYKTVMVEDIERETIATYGCVTDDLRRRIDNTTLLMLQDEIEHLGQTLEQFGLPSPDTSLIIRRNPRVIQDEVYEATTQIAKSSEMVQNFNADQPAVYVAVMLAVNDDNYSPRLFFG